eukprot:9891738-Lingulodinium_polyedra.AAC.1
MVLRFFVGGVGNPAFGSDAPNGESMVAGVDGAGVPVVAVAGTGAAASAWPASSSCPSSRAGTGA